MNPTGHIPQSVPGARRAGAAARRSPRRSSRWRSPRRCSPSRRPRGRDRRTSPWSAAAGGTASACRSGAPTATPRTAGPTRRSSSTTTRASPGKVANDAIRVRLRGGLSSVKLTCASRYRAITSSGAARDPRRRHGHGDLGRRPLQGDRRRAGEDVRRAGHLQAQPPACSPRSPPTTGADRQVPRRAPRHPLPRRASPMVNKLPLESYLYGVVPLEMSASWPAEALKAQACAARSYAERSRKPGEAFDVYCTTRDQAYGGVRAETQASNSAVRACAGVVPKYNGEPIAAFYFSTSGGHTESIENVWQTSPDPLPQGRRRPVRHVLAPPPLAREPDRAQRRLVQGKLGAYSAENPTGVKGDAAGRSASLKRGTSPRVVKAAHHRHEGRDLRLRRLAALQARPARHLGHLHRHVAGRPAPRPSPTASAPASAGASTRPSRTARP